MTQSTAALLLDLVLVAAKLVAKMEGLDPDISDDELVVTRERSRRATAELRELVDSF